MTDELQKIEADIYNAIAHYVNVSDEILEKVYGKTKDNFLYAVIKAWRIDYIKQYNDEAVEESPMTFEYSKDENGDLSLIVTAHKRLTIPKK